MYRPPGQAHNEVVRASRAVLLAGVCVGVATLAVIGSVAVGWGSTPTYQNILYALFTLTITVIGGLIAVRHPGSPVGWILAGFGTFDTLGSLLSAYGHRASLEGWPAGPPAEWLGFGSWSPAVLMWILTMLVIPTGRLPGPRWRIVACAGFAGMALYIPATLLDPGNGTAFVSGVNPYARPGQQWGIMTAVGGALMTLALAGSLASLVVRYRRAGPVERLQLKWVALAGLIIVVLVPVCIAFWSRSPFVQALTPMILIVVALCMGAAVLWYRLFDVDLIVNRTVVYLALSMLLAAAYGATAIVLGAVLGGQSSWTVAGGTLIAAVVFRPLRRKVQDLVDRRFDRRRYDAHHLVAEHLGAASPPRSLEATLATALHDRTLSVAYWLPAEGRWVTAEGRPDTLEPGDIEVSRNGQPVARVRIDRSKADGRLASELASEVVAELDNVRLRAEVASQLEEVRQSRARIVAAQAAERRRIERNLHDGAQQRLLGLAMQLRAVQMGPGAGGSPERAALERAVEELGEAVRELRDLANGLHPVILADGGLAAALDDLAGRAPLPVSLDVPPVRLPPEIEETLWFVACEALANTIKHASAGHAELKLVVDKGTARLICSDDGIGGADLVGSGLRGITDRTEAVGGELHVDSPTGTGTTIQAVIPCGS
jgi:signal transduction histidine kinase